MLILIQSMFLTNSKLLAYLLSPLPSKGIYIEETGDSGLVKR